MVLALPLLTLALLEVVLRLVGFGHPTSFFLREQMNGKDVLVDNPWFGLSFFPPALARSPGPVCIQANKPPGTYRIFLLGESAALGDPRPAYGVGRFLETMLRGRYPGTDFEVVCVAMTAINSHAILPMARECARFQGDLWIVYMGNNEFVGPFGANTVFGAQAPPTLLVRGYLALQQMRIGQGLVKLARGLRTGKETPASWSGLKMFVDQQLAPTDRRKARVYDSFQRNLKDILALARRARVPVILSSVACNLKDCFPFGSLHDPALQEIELAKWRKLYELGVTNEAQGNFAEALTNYMKAAELSPNYAELQYRLGQYFLANTNSKAAQLSLVRARDLDTLPFRADSKLNQCITQTAERYASDGVDYVDAERVLGPLSPDTIPGEESFYEHVHLNPDGNYQLARTFAEYVAKRLPANITRQRRPNWAVPEVCAKSLGLTDWNRAAILEEMLRRLSEAPFSGQFDSDARLRRFASQLAQIKARMLPGAVATARSVYETALTNRPQDHWLHHNYAEFLTGMGNFEEATIQMRAVCDLLPYHHAGYFQLGRLLARQKKYDEARSYLESALRLRADGFDVNIELGQILAAQGKLEEALDQYVQAQDAHPGEPRVHLLEADILAKQHKRPESIQHLRQATALQSSYWEAHELLGIQLALDGQYLEAQAEFEEVVRLRPTHAEGHLNLGIALARQHRFREAVDQFETTLRLDPQNEQARQFLSNMKPLGTRIPDP
jgi:tetratricopeptide (TPR) repeat protein